jgi:hypothetical protein
MYRRSVNFPYEKHARAYLKIENKKILTEKILRNFLAVKYSVSGYIVQVFKSLNKNVKNSSNLHVNFHNTINMC